MSLELPDHVAIEKLQRPYNRTMNESVLNRLSQRIYSNEPTKSPIKDVLLTQSALGISSKRKDATSFFLISIHALKARESNDPVRHVELLY